MAPPGAIPQQSQQLQQELVSLQRRLGQRLETSKKLEAQLAALRAEKEAVRKSCLAGVEAAHRQMAIMRAEIEPATRRQDDRPTNDAGLSLSEEKGRRQQLKFEARQLRQELIKWQHHAEVLEAELPRHETEIVRLKAEVTHSHDILESTRNAIRHLEVEHGLQIESQEDGSRKLTGSSGQGLSTHPEATAERRIRQRAEEKNAVLVNKARRLTGVLAAQQLLIQRLEKQLLREEGLLEQRELRLAGSERLQAHLKFALRRRSDDVVAAALLGRGSQSASLPKLD